MEPGRVLSINKNVEDPDGGTGALSYSWQITTDIEKEWEEVGSLSTYKITNSDEGKNIKLIISYFDAQGFYETISISGSQVQYFDDGNADFAISENTEKGQTLSILETSADPDGTGDLSYSWQISTDVENEWEEVGTESTFKITNSDEGKNIKAVISYQDQQGFNELTETDSLYISFINNGKAIFSISGDVMTGKKLSVEEESVDPDGTGDLSYSWQISPEKGLTDWKK